MEVLVIPFRQEGTQMYAGAMRVDDLMRMGKVDVYRQEDGAEDGYQRLPETGRTGKVARYLQSDSKPLMPTSILLSYRGSLGIDPHQNEPTNIEIPEGEILWIVDGQHRLYGFRRAIEELGVERLRDYLLPVVIVENPSIEDEANQFRVINETMKKVRTDLARRILAMRIAGLGRVGRQEVRISGRLWEAVSVDVIRMMNTHEDSPWLGRIQAPNVRKQPQHVIRELSFSTSLKPILNERPYRSWTPDRIAQALKSYWKAWQSLAPEAFTQADDYVLLKTPGVFSLHEVAYHVLEVLRFRNINQPSEADFLSVLKDLGYYATAEYWRRDNPEGAALAGSMKGFSILADGMQDELITAGHTTE